NSKRNWVICSRRTRTRRALPRITGAPPTSTKPTTRRGTLWTVSLLLLSLGSPILSLLAALFFAICIGFLRLRIDHLKHLLTAFLVEQHVQSNAAVGGAAGSRSRKLQRRRRDFRKGGGLRYHRVSDFLLQSLRFSPTLS